MSKKTLCEWSKQDIDKHYKKLSKIVINPKYYCRKCARAASNDKYLCKAEKL